MRSVLRRSSFVLRKTPPRIAFGRAGRTKDDGRRTIWIAIVAATLLVATNAAACPVCFGDPNAPMQKGVNAGIWVLLGVIGFVQVGFVALFWSFRQRTKELQRRREALKVIEGGAH
jgi:hypothetical protein